MLDESSTRRPPAPRPYLTTPAMLFLSSAVIESTLDLLQRAGSHEACVFWYGERLGDVSQVRSVRAPVQRSAKGNYHVEPEGMSQMVRDLPEIWRPLAQIHSHPGYGTEHSRYDDRMVSSRKVLSIVFPVYGRSSVPWPAGVGVHEWQVDYWHMLTPQQVRARVMMRDAQAPEVRDFR